MAGLFQEKSYRKTSQKIYLVVKDLFLIELFFVGQRVEQFLREISFTSLPGELNVNHQRRWKRKHEIVQLRISIKAHRYFQS